MNVASTKETYPVGTFDHFFLNDDTDDCPANFFVRMTFDGLFNHDLFERSVRLALVRHPLLRALLKGKSIQPRKRLAYTTAEADPYIRWARMGEPYVHPEARTRIDLSREYGFRLFIHENIDESVVVLQVHHAVVDGTGALMFLEDILAFYEDLEQPGAGAPRLRPLDAAKLHTRGSFHVTPRRSKAGRRIDFREATRFASRFPHPLYSGTKTMRPGVMPAPTSVWHEFDNDRSAMIRGSAKSLGGTLNDFLLWNLFRAVAGWNRSHNPRKAPRLRVGLPINMRQPEDADVPACNIVGLYLVDRAGAVLGDDAALYRSIVEETERVKHHQLGLVFVRLIRVLSSIPGGLALLLMRKPLMSNCVETVTLSNLGLALSASPMMHQDGRLRAGSLTLKRIELLPPVRYMTHGSFGVASYDGRMVVTLHYDPRFLGHETADAILRTFVERTAETVNTKHAPHH